MLAPMHMHRPRTKTFFMPRMLANLAAGTMLTTEPRRNTVLTYAWAWEPTPKSSPMEMSERFIMVLIRGVITVAKQTAMRSFA